MKIVLCHFVQFVLLVNLSYWKNSVLVRGSNPKYWVKKDFWNFVLKQTVIKLVSWSNSNALSKWQINLKQKKSEKKIHPIYRQALKKCFFKRKKHAFLKSVLRAFKMKKLTQELCFWSKTLKLFIVRNF